MSTKNVKLIFLREARDQLRDRRTLFMVAVLPLLLYPALGIGMAQMMNTFSEQTRTVAVLGAADLPDPPLLAEQAGQWSFVRAWFTSPEDADKLQVVTERSLAEPSSTNVPQDVRLFLEEAAERRPQIEKLGALTRRRTLLEEKAVTNAAAKPALEEIQALVAQEEALRQEIDGWFKAGPVQVLILVPREFRTHLDEINQRLSNREPIDDLVEATPRPVVVQNSADEKSAIAARRVRDAVRNWEQQVLEARLAAAHLPASLPQVVDATAVDLAAESELTATLWSKLFPMLLVMMAVTGAFYPAIDLGAGEKERGTMETLLICPATRTEIVTGKFLTVMLFSFSTALLNLLSMAATSKYLLTMAAGGALSKLGGASLPPAASLASVVLLAVPLAALFSALSLALAMFARSSKEGQYYLTPLLIVTMGLTMFCLNPGVEINPYYSVFPIVGPALLLKALLVSQVQSHLPAYLVAVLVSSLGYSALALWWAIEQFKSEEVLFRESERFELGAWIRHVLRDREPTPSFTEAGFCFVLILMLQFASMGVLGGAITKADGPADILKLQTIFLIVTVGTPALLMSSSLTTSIRQTLKLRWPGWTMLGVATALAFVLLPVMTEIISSLHWFFPKPSKAVTEFLGAMSSQSVSWWFPLLAFAIAPAICEELAFRGFILSGLQRARSPWVPIILSSIAFGVVHQIPQQVFNAMLLGIVIGLMAVRSGSLWPGVWFHFLFNGAQVLFQRLDLEAVARRTDDWLFRIETVDGETMLRIEWPLLLPCLVASALLISWLVRSMRERPAAGSLLDSRTSLAALKPVRSGT
jgi:sodium transport system permease protein